MFKVPMIFPGQASQSVGMAQDLRSGSGPGSAFLAEIDATLDHGLSAIMAEGPPETLTETWNAQPAILAHSVAVALELRERGIEPSIVAGHSLGEFSAAVAVGSLTPQDGLRLVRRRGELMFAAGREVPGTMAAVMGLEAEVVDRICREVAQDAGVVVMANHNSSSQIAISGENTAVDAACEALKSAGARRAMRLNVSGAFHSPLLAEASNLFSEHLSTLAIPDPEAPVVANVSATAVDNASGLLEGFRAQLTSPVRWHESLTAIVAGEGQPKSPQVVLEVGPGRVLSNMAKREFPDTVFLPLGTADDLDKVLDKLGEILT